MRVYHVSPRRRWGLWYILGPIIVALIWLGAGGGSIEGRPFFLTAGITGCIGVAFQIIIDRATLELSTDGARLRQTGYTLAARWSDITDLSLSPGREGFVTREPMTGRGAGVLAAFRGTAVIPGLPLYDAEQQHLLAEKRFIPIEAFAWHLQHGQMREDIARSAPHLAHLLLSK